jgi:prepilin-type N-terminal cleavage/methylation domain-containing protein
MKRPIQPSDRDLGFTLLEALIALVVLAVGMLALAQFHAAALRSSADAKARTQAVTLGQAKSDQLRTYYTKASFTLLSDSPSAETVGTATSGDLAVSGMDWVEDFSRSWTVTGEYVANYDCDTNTNINNTSMVEKVCDETSCTCWDGSDGPPCPCPDTNCDYAQFPAVTDACHQKRITTTVSWTDVRGVTQSIVLQTIVEGTEPLYSGLALSGTIPGTAAP